MKLEKSLKNATLVGLGAVMALAATMDASAADRVKWKMQSAWSSSVPLAGVSGVRFEEDIKVLSDGKFEIRFYEPGALVPALETFDAVSKGAIDSAWTTPGYHTGKYPGLAFMTTVPFGPQLGEFLAWKWFGGGNEIRDEIYAQHNLVAFDAFSHGAETSGWFKEPIVDLDQMKGLKMRFFGLGARVMQKLGVSTQLLSAADIYPALERGVIDATEYSMPVNDINLGFYQIAKNNYYPGWHQQVSVSELIINRDRWNELPESYKKMVEVSTQRHVVYTFAESEAINFEAMQQMQSKYGVTNRRWSDEQLAAFEKAWLEVVEEESAKDELFKRFADSYFAYREKYKLWGEAQGIKASYLE